MSASRGAFDSVLQAAKEGLNRWLDRARDVVMTPWRRYRATPDPTALAATVPLWQEQVDRILQALTPALREGWAAAHLPGDYDPQDPYIQANLALTYNLLVRVPDEVHAMVVAAILEGTNNGESTEQIARRVDDILTFTGSENWNHRAQVIAQTECLVSDSVVDGANVTHVYRRWFEGTIVTVSTDDGAVVAGTPNHPVLTARGWVALGDLTEADYLVRDVTDIEGPGPARNPDVEAEPPTIAEIFDALQTVGVIERVAGRKPDFHGDGADSDIDVASSDRPLRIGRKPLFHQDLIDLVLKGALLRHGSVGSGGSLLLSTKEIAYTDGLLQGAELNARSRECSSDSCRTDCVCAGYDGGRKAGVVQSSNDLHVHGLNDRLGLPISSEGSLPSRSCRDAGLDEGSSNCGLRTTKGNGDGGDGHARVILLDRVGNIKIAENCSQFVYNLTTVEGFFSVDGIYTKNCNRHFNGSMLAHGLLREKAGESGLSKQWDTVMDGKERKAHELANGDVQPLGQPFIVDGEALLFPGDPTGKPSNVINCRCEIRLTRNGELT